MTYDKQVVIFGGSFNPPTLAHEAIIRACLALPQFDEVWVMPSGNRADKTILVSDEHRLQMLRLVKASSFQDNTRLIISDFELQLPRPSETRRTLAELHKTYPAVNFWFAMGGDSYHTLPTWPGADEFMPGLQLVVFTGPGTQVAAQDHVLPITLPPEFDDTSSTEVRNLVAHHTSASALVSPAVLEYVTMQHIY